MTTYTNLHITTPLHCLAIGFLLHQTLFRRLALETNASTISIQAFIGKVEMISRTRVLGAADVMWKHAYQTLHRSKLLFAILWCASLCAKIFRNFSVEGRTKNKNAPYARSHAIPRHNHNVPAHPHFASITPANQLSSLFCIDREMKYSPVLTNPILPLSSRGSPESSNRSSLRGLIAIHAGKELVSQNALLTYQSSPFVN